MKQQPFHHCFKNTLFSFLLQNCKHTCTLPFNCIRLTWGVDLPQQKHSGWVISSRNKNLTNLSHGTSFYCLFPEIKYFLLHPEFSMTSVGPRIREKGTLESSDFGLLVNRSWLRGGVHVFPSLSTSVKPSTREL